MLKHATITRTNRAQQVLQLQKQLGFNSHQQIASDEPPSSLESFAYQSDSSGDGVNHFDATEHKDHIISPLWQSTCRDLQQTPTTDLNSCNSSPTPSLLSTPISKFPLSPSAPSSVFSSPSKSQTAALANGIKISDTRSVSGLLLSTTTNTLTSNTSKTSLTAKCGSESMIKVFAQTLSQDVEYVTLHVNAQTKSQQIIRSLLRKFRLKHRDPNLFYLTLERWIRKDGLKFKSVMLLSDEACPLQLQQCCSNPPHNDIKFTLQMRAGALMKIHCSDVCSDVRYKCLSLSSQTTVEETIELMLHCLNLTGNQNTNHNNNNSTNNTPTQFSSNTTSAQSRLSPILPTDSSSSSSSSSSSGIESDPTTTATTNHNSSNLVSPSPNHPQASRQLDANSRTSSLTSISSTSNLSSSSGSQSSSEQYCLVIECRDTNYRKILESDEYLVDNYQNLLDEVRDQPVLDLSTSISSDISAQTKSPPNNLIKQQPDQWFIIKLKRRDDITQPSIKFTNPRQNMPLPPIPLSLVLQNNANDLKHIVSTTQIEVNHQKSNSINISNRQLHNQKQPPPAPPTMPPLALARQQVRNHAHWPSCSTNTISIMTNASGHKQQQQQQLTINTTGVTATDTVDGPNYTHHNATMTIGRSTSNVNSHNHRRQLSVAACGSGSAVGSMPPPPASLI